MIPAAMEASRGFGAEGPMSLREGAMLLCAAALLMEERRGEPLSETAYAIITSGGGGTCGFGLASADAELCAIGNAVAKAIGPTGRYVRDGQDMASWVSIQLKPKAGSASARAAHAQACRALAGRVAEIAARGSA